MNTKQLKYVLTLAREGSFSKAADVLSITQPSLSQYIRKIEKDVGLELFDRSGGELRLTDAGRVYVGTGRKILDLEHQLEVQISDLMEHKAGSLIIGAAPYRAAGMIPAIAAEFRKRYPGMHLIVREGTTAELAEGMERGEYDLALTLLPVDRRMFSLEKVVEEELVLAVPVSWPVFDTVEMLDRRYPAVDASVLEGQRMVMLTESQFMQRQLKNLLMDHHLTASPAVIVKSLEAQIAMVRAGLGMALMPTGIESFCAEQEVRFYSFTQALPRREVAIIWRKDRELSQAEKELKSLILGISW